MKKTWNIFASSRSHRDMKKILSFNFWNLPLPIIIEEVQQEEIQLQVLHCYPLSNVTL
jgi:hypothetical protein